jgi:predicted TPR repeat methyltransferase
MKKQTYGELWDRYVAESFPKLQESDSRLTYPGEEWGNEASWQRIFDKLFVPSGVADWDAAIEIGGGGGKYTERVLRANDKVRVFGFDVSKNFLEATGARLPEFVAANRLSLNEIDSVAPDAMFSKLESEGLVRKVDAMFSIDAMVHVDLQYLFTYWVNAALLLKPGGRVLMTLADPTTVSGLQKITRDIRKFYKFQGRICPKFEYLSEEIVRHVLTSLGFEIELAEAWSYHDGRPARDIYLIARLDHPERADAYRDALRQDPNAQRPMAEKPETYADLWDRMADFATADRFDRALPSAVMQRLEQVAGAGQWQRAVELGLGDTRFTQAALNSAPQMQLTTFQMSGKLRAATAASFANEIAAGRLAVKPFDPVHPDFIYKVFERERQTGKVDAVFSVDTLLHLDLQYQFAWFVNAALILKPGGWLAFNVADATTSAGFAKLVSDIRTYFPFQGQACTRFEWQSPSIIRGLLEALGFEIVQLWNWDSQTGYDNGRDLWAIARMARPEQALAFRPHISIGLPIPTFATPAPDTEETSMPDLSEQEKEIARALGQAYWRQLFIQANPDITKEQLKEQLKEQWGGARRDYTKLGQMVMRQLGNMGFQISKSDKAKAKAD